MPEEAGQRAVQCGLRQSNQADTEFHGVGTELYGKYNSSIRRFWPDASQRLPRRRCSAKLRANFVELRVRLIALPPPSRTPGSWQR